MLLQAASPTATRSRIAADPLVRRLQDLAKAVRRDIHKMHAFVRFREIDDRASSPSSSPSITSSASAASFFVNRFTNMRWSILTPELSIHWDGETLSEGPGATRAEAPSRRSARGDLAHLLRVASSTRRG